MNYAIIVAGGKGLRMGGDVPKQFLPVGGVPILMRTIQAFHEALFLHGKCSPCGSSGYSSLLEGNEGGLILVLPRDQQAYWRQLCDEYQFTVPHQVATGGETRFHSVRNGLSLIPDDADGVVGVHDGVRPFVSADVIRRCYQVAVEEGTAVPVIPVVETIRQLIEDDSQTVDRSHYRLVQTPQTFRIPLLKEAYRQPYQSSFTDDASVVEALGRRITLVEGNRENIKITTPSDIQYAEFLVRQA